MDNGLFNLLKLRVQRHQHWVVEMRHIPETQVNSQTVRFDLNTSNGLTAHKDRYLYP